MLHVDEITYRVGTRTLLEGASAHVPDGARFGLVGDNGSGKTTLLRLILGEIEPSGGSISLRKRASVGTVSQRPPSGEQSPLEEVLATDRQRQELLEQAAGARDAARIAEAHDRLAETDAHAAPARAAAILAGLGFDERMQRAPLSRLSGGWRMRVALAGALFAEPDLLLLDEPTNHLDLESSLWLESFLRRWPHTLLVVSHDRELLNRIVEGILHIEEERIRSYRGAYDDFERALAERREREGKLRRRRESERVRLLRFVDRFRAKASKAKQAQSRIKKLERLSPVRVSREGRRIAFCFPRPAASPSPLVKLAGAAVGYEPGPDVLTDLELSIYSEDRIALLGANGNGKTTLARLLSGELWPSTGEMVRSGKLVTGYFAQDQLEQLDPRHSALEQLRILLEDEPIDKLRARLGGFGFEQERAEVPVSGLSGGERTRLALALATARKPNLLVLDEPTNNLDISSREALVEGLNEFEGAIVLISHDRHLIESTAERLWVVGRGGCGEFFGDLADYRTRLLESRGRRERKGGGESPRRADGEERPSRKQERRRAAEERARIAPLRREVEQVERSLERLHAEKEEIDSRLADPGIYSDAPEELPELTRRQQEIAAALDDAEQRWLETQLRLEEAE
jgi:ATP-binding cassette, subfamily F, member 3